MYVDGAGYVVPVNKAADWRTRPHIKHPWNGPAVEWTDWVEIAATLESDALCYFLEYTIIATIDIKRQPCIMTIISKLPWRMSEALALLQSR